MDVNRRINTRKGYNPNAQKLETYSSMCNQELSCVYVDVNGLHELNNTRGYAAGDKMLQFVGKTLQKEFGERNSFRIGGDEFVVLAIGENAELINLNKYTDEASIFRKVNCYVYDRCTSIN